MKTLTALVGERDADIIKQLSHVYGESDAGKALKHLVAAIDSESIDGRTPNNGRKPIPGHPIWCAIHAGYFCTCLYVPKGLGGQA